MVSSLAVLISSTAPAATLSFSPDAIDGDGTFDVDGTVDFPGESVGFTTTVTTAGTNGAGADVRSPSGNTRMRLVADDTAGADNQPNWTNTFALTFDQPLDGLVLQRATNVVQTDWARWTVSWTKVNGSGGSEFGTLQGNTGSSALLYSDGFPAPLISEPLPNGNFTSGTTWRFDTNGTAQETTGAGASEVAWSLTLPSGITALTISGNFYPFPATGTMNVRDEGMDLDVTNATIGIPEPTSSFLLSMTGLLVLVRRR